MIVWSSRVLSNAFMQCKMQVDTAVLLCDHC